MTIEPDGQWRNQAAEPEHKRARYSSNSAKVEDDDDISILSDSRGLDGASMIPKFENNSFATPSHFNPATPNSRSAATTSREPSSVARSGGVKRPAEVIDLTLSSDEEDEPVSRPPKRQNYGSGLSNSGLGYSQYQY